MILNNYKSMMNMVFSYNRIKHTFVNTSGVEEYIYVNVDSAYCGYILQSTAFSKLDTLATSTAGYGVVFGTGTTPPTPNDYTISGEQIKTIAATSQVSCIVNDDGSHDLIAEYVIHNTGSTAFTIGEIAYIATVVGGPAKTTSSNRPCMMDRTVLDVPVTVEADGVCQLTYKIKMSRTS